MDAVGIRRRLGAAAVETFLEGMARTVRLHPRARRALREVEITKDLAYGPLPEHRLDVWRRPDLGPGAPVVFFVHGGGFRILSKDTHWMMALRYAQAGYVVFTINYRLAPEHPFPSPLEDTALAWQWVLDHAAEHGGDPARMALAGESAGANLILALTVMACFERPEPWAREVFARGAVPTAVLPACGMLQVTDPERFAARPMPTLYRDRIHGVCLGYLGDHDSRPGRATELADPLRVVESDAVPARPLPPAYLCVGSADPIEEDTHRLAAALARRGVAHVLDVFDGEPHAFHAFVWRPAARACWKAQFAFLQQQFASSSPRAA
ncbi:MAG: alpha/beta hydrolase [Myxococcota bacterium]